MKYSIYYYKKHIQLHMISRNFQNFSKKHKEKYNLHKFRLNHLQISYPNSLECIFEMLNLMRKQVYIQNKSKYYCKHYSQLDNFNM